MLKWAKMFVFLRKIRKNCNKIAKNVRPETKNSILPQQMLIFIRIFKKFFGFFQGTMFFRRTCPAVLAAASRKTQERVIKMVA